MLDNFCITAILILNLNIEFCKVGGNFEPDLAEVEMAARTHSPPAQMPETINSRMISSQGAGAAS